MIESTFKVDSIIMRAIGLTKNCYSLRYSERELVKALP